jgi:serine/threonine-protein kinase ULK/ATG1
MKDKNITCFEEKDALYFFQQIMNGFFELRKNKILHRDFKLDNIFMNEETVIIGDFGFAKSGTDITATKIGTPLTMAPELLFSNGNMLIYNSKADLWSIGVVFFQILFGKPPYFAETIPELQKELLKNTDDNMKYPKPVSDEAKDLLRRLLTIDQKKRI